MVNDLHSLRVSLSEKTARIEAVHPHFVKEGLLRAREQSWKVLHELRGLMREGMTEKEGEQLARQVFSDYGVKKHWHPPNVRFGTGTALTYDDPTQPTYRLMPGDPFYLDLGPVWQDLNLGLAYEGDVGDTFVFGTHKEAEQCAKAARNLFNEAQMAWQANRWNGQQIYQFLRQRATELGYVLLEQIDGHRLADFPHHSYSKESLGHFEFPPSNLLWVLEVQIKHPSGKFGAFYEDILQSSS